MICKSTVLLYWVSGLKTKNHHIFNNYCFFGVNFPETSQLADKWTKAQLVGEVQWACGQSLGHGGMGKISSNSEIYFCFMKNLIIFSKYSEPDAELQIWLNLLIELNLLIFGKIYFKSFWSHLLIAFKVGYFYRVISLGFKFLW